MGYLDDLSNSGQTVNMQGGYLDKLNASLNFKPQVQPKVDLGKPSGLTLFTDPSKFYSAGAGIQNSLPPGPLPEIPSLAAAKAQAVAAHPNYETAGKILGTSLLGGLGGAEGATGKALLTNIAKSAGLADISQGGASTGQALAPGNPLAPILGGLAAPFGAVGALGALRSTSSAIGSKFLPTATPETNALQDISSRQNIPLSLGDITGQEGKGWGGVERFLEKTPFSGMVKFRAGQQAALQGRAPQILDTFAGKIPQESIDDPQNALQGYLGNAEQTARTLATNKYNEFLGKAAQADSKVSITNLKAAANNILAEEKNMPPDMQLSSTSTAKAISELPDELGIKVASMWDKRLGGLASAAQKRFNTGNVTKEDLRAYTMLNQSLGGENGDLAQFAKTQPSDIVGSYNDAKKFYAENVGPFNEPDIRKIGSDRFDTDTLLTKMIKNNRPQLAEQLMTVLPQEGQATLKYAVLNKLMENSNLGSDVKAFSPKQFANRWSALGATKDALFSPEEKQMIDGYSKLASVIPEPMANPRTGAETTGLWAPITAIAAGIKTAGAGLLGGRALTSMLTQPWGQRLLMTAATTKNTGLLKRLAVTAQATLANPGSVSAGTARMNGVLALPPQLQLASGQ